MISVFALGMALLISCCDNPVGPSPDPSPIAPWGNEEAKLMALCLSGELTAPQDLYNTILDDLSAIRSKYKVELRRVRSLRFYPPWEQSCLIIAFDSATVEAIDSGNYHAWDELNQSYNLIRIDPMVSIGAYVLYFEGRLHPHRLGDLYEGLPGVGYVEPNHCIGDSPNIYPMKFAFRMTYLFRDAWGDCLSGCIASEYWYFGFLTSSNEPTLIGHWDPRTNPDPPGWFEDAQKNIELYRSW